MFRQARTYIWFAILIVPVFIVIADGSKHSFRSAPITPTSPLAVTKQDSALQRISDVELFATGRLAQPLAPINATVNARENRRLLAILNRFHARTNPDDLSLLEGFVSANPLSRWTPSIQANLGEIYFRSGYFTRATKYFRLSFNGSRSVPSGPGKSVADYALGQYALMLARIGRTHELDQLLAEVAGRPVSGVGAEYLRGAREGRSMMKTHPGLAYRCGPYAVENLARALGRMQNVPEVEQLMSTSEGTSLTELAAYAPRTGLDAKVVFREKGAPVIFPSVVHWKLGHFAALVETDGQRFRSLDPTFKQDIWISKATLDEEASGYFLVARNQSLPPGWREVGNSQVANIRGKGFVNGLDPSATGPGSPFRRLKCPNGRGGRGMAEASIQPQLISLNLSDTPIDLDTAYGPAVNLTIVYNQREWGQPANFAFSNFGAKWTHNWNSYVEDNSGSPNGTINHFTRGGGSNQNYYQTGGFWQSDRINGQMRRLGTAGSGTDPLRYELTYSEGGKETFANWDGATAGVRRFFLTSITDKFGQTLTLEYGSGMFGRRLSRIVDASGQVSLTFNYRTEPGNEFVIASVLGKGTTSDVGRAASFSYNQVNGALRLTTITDPVGIQSNFTYGDPSMPDFITKLDTPEGSGQFSTGLLQSSNGYTAQGWDYWFESTTTEGLRERYEFRTELGSLPNTDATLNSIVYASPVPVATGTSCCRLWRNSFHWGPQQMATFNGIIVGGGHPQGSAADLVNATWLQWYHGVHDSIPSEWVASPVLEASKEPRENWIAYQYGTTPGNLAFLEANTPQLLRAVGRFLPGGVPQVTSTTYDSNRDTTGVIDPLCRKTTSTFSASDELLELRQAPGIGGSPGSCTDGGQAGEIIAKYDYFPSGHPMFGTRVPKRMTNANGRTLEFDYDSFGRPIAMIDQQGKSLHFSYITSGFGLGKLASIRGTGNSGADVVMTTMEYDAQGRPYRVSTAEGTTITYEFDAIDRIKKITYPDGSTEQASYLDPMTAAPRLSETEFIDRVGRVSRYKYDADGRLIEESRVDQGQTLTTKFEWCSCGALRKLTDPNNNVTRWEFDIQGRKTRKLINETEVERYVYEGQNNPHVDGNSRLSQIVRPGDSSITYTYFPDNLIKRFSSGSGPAERFGEYSYDSIYARVTQFTDNVGTTTYTYKPRPTAIPAPTVGNGLLESIDGPIQGTIDRFTFGYDELDQQTSETLYGLTESVTYDAFSRITSYTNPLGSFQINFDGDTSRALSKGYPSASGLSTTLTYTAAADDYQIKSFQTNAAFPAYTVALQNATYTKDLNLAGFQTIVTNQNGSAIGGSISSIGYKNGRLTQFGGNSWTYDAAGNITSFQPASGPVRSYAFNALNQITSPGFVYNDQGQLTADGSRTYEWTPMGELSAVVQGSRRTEITYDGFGRFHRIKASENGAIIRDDYYIWQGNRLAAMTPVSAAPLNITKRYFQDGYTINGSPFYYVRDYMGSVAQVRGASGALVNLYKGGALASEPYSCEYCTGSAANQSDFGYGGYFWLPTSSTDGLYLTRFRPYDPHTQRFLSRDPLGETGGPNLYAHGSNNWLNRTDSMGLFDKRYSPDAGVVKNNSRFTLIGCDNYDQNMRDSGQCYVIPPGCYTKRWRDLDYLYSPETRRWSHITRWNAGGTNVKSFPLVPNPVIDPVYHVRKTPLPVPGVVADRIPDGKRNVLLLRPGFYPFMPGVKDKLVNPSTGDFVKPLKCALCVGDPRVGDMMVGAPGDFERLSGEVGRLGKEGADDAGIESVGLAHVIKNTVEYLRQGGERTLP